ADGAHAAVEIQKQILRGGGGIGGGHGVELLGTGGIDLIEGKGPQLDRDLTQSVLNVARPIQNVILKAEDYIGLFAVDVDENCGDICKLAAKLFHHLVGVGQFGPGADQTNHDLAAVGAAPQEDVADQAFAGFFIVGLDAVLFQQAAQGAADFVEDRRLQFA